MTAISPPESLFELPDGRALGWTEYGAPGGKPVFNFHGLPSSRLEAAVTEPRASRMGLRIAAQPWGFDPGAILAPVHLLHGDRDRVVPHSMSVELAGLIPNAKVEIFPGEGHYSLPVRHAREALELLRANF